MRRPGIVVPPGTPTDANLMLSWQPGAITCNYAHLQQNQVSKYKVQHPDATIIVRFQHPHNWFTNLETTAVRYAMQIAGKWNELKPLDPLVIFANEMNRFDQNGDPDEANQPLYETEQFYQSVGWWITRTAQVIKSLAPKMKLVAPPFSPGRHEDGSPNEHGNITEPFAGYDYLADAIHAYFDDTLAFHAYWGDPNGSSREWLQDPEISSWHAFRWRRLLALCKTRYNIDAKIVIDEAGNFATYDSDFFEQLTYFSQHTLNDPRVLALTYYIWEDPTANASNIFNVWTQYIPDLKAFTRRLAAQPDILPGSTPPADSLPAPSTATAALPDDKFTGIDIRVMLNDGRIETMPLETYLRGVVPAEIPASWHPEALKAQAIAARTYAANAIRRARYLGKAFDIRDDPKVAQNYRPDKIHPATDQAILDTKGLVLLYGRHPIDAVYSANCGGHTLNSEDVFKKPDGSPASPTPYLRGVPCPAPGPKNGHGVGLCQNGAQLLAKAGFSFNRILTYYYTGVTIAPWQYKETAPPSMTTVGVTSPGNWTVNIKRVPGFSIIVGNLADRPDIAITITTPRGDTYVTRSGAKPEFGAGGFEALTTAGPGVYTLEFLGQRFSVQMDGKTTARLDFKTTETSTPAAQSTISGILSDARGTPLGGRTVRLQAAHNVQAFTTGAEGRYMFENLPAGTYNLADVASGESKTITLDGREFKTVNLTLPAAPSDGDWVVESEVWPGSIPLLVGDIGVANEPITVTAPSGAQSIVISGGKPEYGPGGFEAYAPEKGIYTLQFSKKTFTIPTTGKMLHLTFKKQQPEAMARLISSALPLSKINTLLKQLKSSSPAGDLFTIEEV